MAVTIDRGELTFRFPEVNADATLRIRFMQTLRVPADSGTYGLPPGLGTIEAVEIDSRVRLPMWQSEATWLNFESRAGYPFLVKVGVGGIDAVTGETYSPQPDFADEDYFEVPLQPWLDGFRRDAHTVAQFVAAPLGRGYTPAEQIIGTDDGTMKISVIPLDPAQWIPPAVCSMVDAAAPMCAPPLSLGAGGSISQEIATPVIPHERWLLDAGVEAEVGIVNSVAWQALTGRPPHREPLTIAEYRRHDLPWFEWYSDVPARQGTTPLSEVKTVYEVGAERGEQALPDNSSFDPPTPTVLKP